MAIHEVYPYLRVRGAAAAIEFYCTAFGATEQLRLVDPSGRVGHAELDFGGATIIEQVTPREMQRRYNETG